MAVEEKSRSMWTNVDKAMAEVRSVLVDVMPDPHADAFVAALETLITELVKAPPRGKNHPSRVIPS